MDDQKIISLKEHIATIRNDLEALMEEAGDFPALESNVRRMRASLNMIQIDFGMTLHDEFES